MRSVSTTLVLVLLFLCMVGGGSAQQFNGTGGEWLSESMRGFVGAAAPAVLDADVVEQGTFESPYYSQPRDFRSIRGTAIFSVFTSTICGHASTAALATRPMTIMNACKPPIFESQPVSQLPLVFSLTDSSLGYYLSNAALNGPFLLGLALLGLLITVFGMQVFNKSFSVSMALVRFPGFLGAPAVFLGHQAITASMTIFTTSTSTGSEMIAGFVAVGFFGLLIPLHLILTLKMLPKYTKYVISFRSVSGTAYAQRRLAEVVQQFHEKLKEEEAARVAKEQERIKREERMSMAGVEELDEDPDAAGSLTGIRQSAAFSAVMSSAGLLGSVAKSFVTNMFSSDSSMLNWEGVDGMDEERLRQIRNATFSSLLEEELRSADEEETAFSLIMVGADRWEDVEEGDSALTEHDLEQKGYAKERGILVCNRHPAKQKLENDDANGENDRIRTKVRAGPPIRNGFVRMFGILFERYRLGYQWFYSVEMFVSFGCGILTGWRPADGSSGSCYTQAALILVLFALYLGVLVATRPYISKFEGALNLIVAALCFVASVLFIMGLSVGNWAHVGAYLLAVMSVYVLILKALLDLYDTIFQHFRKIKQPWDSIEELTRHYMDLDREVSRGKILTQSVFSLRTDEDARQMEVLDNSDNDDYNSDMGGAGSEEEMARHDSGVRVVRRLVNEEDEGLYHQIGGRHKAFVSSRGVPVSLLPFAMEPIPDRITLPARNFNTEDRLKIFERQLMKEAKKRRLAQQLLILNDGEGNLIDLMGMDQVDLETAVEQGKRAKERKNEAAGNNRSANNFASRMGDVADMVEKEHRRNEDKDELRKTALRARTGITDEGKIQSMLEDGKYYDDEPVDYSNLLLNTYHFGDPDASVLRRAPPRPDLYPAISPSPPSSPTSQRRGVVQTTSPKPAAASSTNSTVPRAPADIAGTVLQNLLAAKKSRSAAPAAPPTRAPAKKQPPNFGWDL